MTSSVRKPPTSEFLKSLDVNKVREGETSQDAIEGRKGEMMGAQRYFNFLNLLEGAVNGKISHRKKKDSYRMDQGRKGLRIGATLEETRKSKWSLLQNVFYKKKILPLSQLYLKGERTVAFEARAGGKPNRSL